MASSNGHQYGFRFQGYLGGPGDTPRPIEMPIKSHYQPGDDASVSVDLNIGDPVKQASTGDVTLATTTQTPTGVVIGFTEVWDGSKLVPRNKWPGGTVYGASSGDLYPIPKQTRAIIVPLLNGAIFEIDCDDATTATTEQAYLAFVGENVTHLCVADTTDGNNPKADPVLDISTHATTNTLLWRIVGISKSMKNRDFAGTYVKLLVTANITTLPPVTILGT